MVMNDEIVNYLHNDGGQIKTIGISRNDWDIKK